MIAGIKVTYASIPATLSVSPEAAVAGKTAARPLHAAHTVAPSATCAPHILQNAIGVSPVSQLRSHEPGRATLRQNTRKRLEKQSITCRVPTSTHSDFLLRKVAHQWQFKHLALQRLYDQHHPNDEEPETHHHIREPRNQVTQDGNKKKQEA